MLSIAGQSIKSRLFTGSGLFPSPQTMQEAVVAAASQVLTVSLRRQSAGSDAGDAFFELIRETGAHILPNTAGCHTVAEAVTTAHMAREVFDTNWIKLEVIGDEYTLQPDTAELVEAARILVQDGFEVFPYTTEDLIVAQRLIEVGCKIVMPWASPIGSGQGLLNPFALELLRERLPDTLLVVDAGIGRPSDAARAMELGYDAVLVNSAIALASEPVKMGEAFRDAVRAGRTAYEAGIMEKRNLASPSTPTMGTPFWQNESAPPSSQKASRAPRDIIDIQLKAETCYGKAPLPSDCSPAYPEDYIFAWYETTGTLPWIGDSAAPPVFPSCDDKPLGVYPIVDRLSWVERLVKAGASTIQLRMKDLPEELRAKEIPAAIAIAKDSGSRLFINDDWELAIEHGAYGVHLGQNDLPHADIGRIHAAGLRLGMSTHSALEMSRAWGLRPSYIAIGTVFQTTSKALDYNPLLLAGLQELMGLAPCPVVAIGGIKAAHTSRMVRLGVDGVACISAITEAADPEAELREWQASFDEHWNDVNS